MVGLESFRDPAELYLHRMLLVPFVLKRPDKHVAAGGVNAPLARGDAAKP